MSASVAGVQARTDRAAGWPPEQLEHPVRAIREGFPFRLYEHFAARIGASERQLASALSVTTRTLRRRKKQRARLTPDESDRLWLLIQVFEQAVETFETEERARQWLSASHRMLDGESPLEHLDTTAGADQVRYILQQIEYSMPL